VPPSSDEGALNNDSFQPTNLTAEQLFASGLEALHGEGGPRALESLRSVLAASTTGEGLRLPAGDEAEPTPRTVVGVEAALFWALEGASDTDVAAWCRRFDELARESVRSGSTTADIERRFPATEVGLGSAVRLADEALEAGRGKAALAYLGRAEAHLALRQRAGAVTAERITAIEAALAVRHSALAMLPPPIHPRASRTLPPGWEALAELPRPRTLPFEFSQPEEDPYLADLLGNPSKRIMARGPGLGLRPGLVAIDQDLVAVQTAAGLHLVDTSSATRDRVIEPMKLVEPAFGHIGPSRAARKSGAPGWAHLPRIAGDELFLVVGRAESGRGPNALAAISISSLELGESSPLDLTADEPRADWILSGSRIFSDDGFHDPPLLAPLEGSEIQPGPAIFGDSLLFEARVLDGEVKTYLGALDVATGTPRWLVLVAKGGDLGPIGGARFGSARLPLGSAAPLVIAGGHVLVQTNLGITALFDAVDGRLLWSFKNRRHAPGEPGWSGIAPLVRPGSFAVAPADSDFGYLLANTRLHAPARSPLTSAPLPLESSTDLVAADADALFTFDLAGGERQLSELRLQGEASRRISSILLRTGETFVGLPALGTRHFFASSNRGLFLFDRTRELELIDYLPLPGGAGPREAGGSLTVLGDRLLLLGPGTLWVFELPH
jgi:hypothetical protein